MNSGIATREIGVVFRTGSRSLKKPTSPVPSLPNSRLIRRGRMWCRIATNHEATGEVCPYRIAQVSPAASPEC